MTDAITEVPKYEMKPSYEGVGDRLIQALRESNATTEPKGFEKMGVQAIGGTNETGEEALFEKVRQQKEAPDGYLIAVGAANAFCMLEAFPEGVEPKALLLFDIDPEVVLVGEAIVEHFKTSDQYPEDLLGSYSEDRFMKDEVFPKYGASRFKVAIKKNSALLHKLAQEGRFAIAGIDFTDPALINELSNLPDIQQSNNVIYLSNIADHIWRRNFAVLPDFSFLNVLSSNLPNRNYYVDTLLKGLCYRLRVSTTPPHFQLGDFGENTIDTYFQTHLTDEIDGPNENILWEDIVEWPLERLLATYDELSSRPDQVERKRFVGDGIRSARSGDLEKYEELKRLSKQPPKEILPKRYQVYAVPDDPERERQLLSELAEDYDYDRDFIPYLAHTYWTNANTPVDVNLRVLPQRNNYYRDDKEDKGYYTHNPEECRKGRIEVGYLTKVPYEELAMAKIYREVEERHLLRNHTVKTEGKDIIRLSEKLQFGRPFGK